MPPFVVKINDILQQDLFLSIPLFKHNAFPDSISIKGKTFITFRSAMSHSPTAHSKIVVASRLKSNQWKQEHILSLPDCDCRDPKIVVYNGVVHVYFSVVKRNRYSFQPLKIMHSKLFQDNTWAIPVQVYKAGYIASRVKVIGDDLYMCVYKWNSKNPYISESRIVVSKDAENWSENSFFGTNIQEGTESDCLLVNDNLLWVIRKDFALRSDPGSSIYLISKGGKIVSQSHSRIKYDAPLLFNDHQRIFLISRFQQALQGKYYNGFKWIPKRLNTIGSVCIYWLTSKSTALWNVNLDDLSINKVLNLPSHGDTGYCGMTNDKPGVIDIYNYSSPINGKKVNWRSGQFKSTSIYHYEVRLD